ncbi:MAG: hypothetical protein D6679_12245 [Candidatus Hydrogenedentota bacterium]|nr:MAG: hypothetical protein D6679_12245 [Candidatus Hydrogenedentota bacterium]
MKGYRWLAAVAAVVGVVVIAYATVSPSADGTDGVRTLILADDAATPDSGVGIFTLTAQSGDSIVDQGVFFIGLFSSDTGLPDTRVAQPGQGMPKLLYGKVTVASGAASYRVNASDTALIKATSTFSDTYTAKPGTWSDFLTGSSGTAWDSFVSSKTGQSVFGAVFSDSGGEYPFSSNFGNLWNWDTFLSRSIDTAFNIISANAQFDTTHDTARVVVFNSLGVVVADSQLIPEPPKGGVDTGFTTGILHFDTGENRLFFALWDADTEKYKFFFGKVTVGGYGVADSSVVADSTAVSGRLGAIIACTVTAMPNGSPPGIRRIQIYDVTGDTGGSYADNFAQVDSNTPGFDTRVANTVFGIRLEDANGNEIHSLGGNDSVHVVVKFDFSHLTASQAKTLVILHRDIADNTWEAVTTTADSTAGTLTADISTFSDFAIGDPPVSSGVATAANDNNCLVNRAVGGSVFSGIMPALRSLRDGLMETTLGRFAVEAYYAAAGLLLLGGAAILAGASRRF